MSATPGTTAARKATNAARIHASMAANAKICSMRTHAHAEMVSRAKTVKLTSMNVPARHVNMEGVLTDRTCTRVCAITDSLEPTVTAISMNVCRILAHMELVTTWLIRTHARV